MGAMFFNSSCVIIHVLANVLLHVLAHELLNVRTPSYVTVKEEERGKNDASCKVTILEIFH